MEDKIKKNLLLSVLILVMFFSLVGCGEREVTIVKIEELNNINNQISEYFISNDLEYSNLGAHYVDEDSKMVVVELIVNTSEQQKWFRENVVNSGLIKFIQGGPYTTSDND